MFANAASDNLLRWDPIIEIGIATLCFLASGLQWLDYYLQHRKSGTPWARKQIWQCLISAGIGLMFAVFYFLPND